MRCRIFPYLCLLVIVYFTYHSIWGNRGFSKLMEIREQIALAKEEVERTEQEKKSLTYKTNALKNPKAIDMDILEEEAVRVLGQTRSDTLVIFD